MVIPWIGYSLADAAEEGRADGAGQVRGVHDAEGPRAVPRAEGGLLRRLARLALHRGAAARRGDASADAAHRRHVRPGAAQPERRADPGRHSRGSTASRAPSRSCASDSPTPSPRRPGTRRRRRSTASTRTSTRPSTIRAGARPPSGASASSAGAQTLPVQRLRRSGRVALHRDGPQEELLSVSSGARVALKVGVWLVGLAPLGSMAYWFWTDDLTANPIEFVTRTLGDWALRLLLASLAMTPLRLRVRPRLAADAAPAARSLRLRLRRPALQRVDRARPLLRLAHDGRRHRQAAVDHGGRGGAGAADARWPPRRPPG